MLLTIPALVSLMDLQFHTSAAVSLRFISSPVTAMLFLRLGPLVCESLKSKVCRNYSTQLSQPRLYVHFTNHLFMLISASVETTCVCGGWN